MYYLHMIINGTLYQVWGDSCLEAIQTLHALLGDVEVEWWTCSLTMGV